MKQDNIVYLDSSSESIGTYFERDISSQFVIDNS